MDPRQRFASPRASRAYFLGFTLVTALLVISSFARSFFLPVAHGTFAAPWFVYVHGGFFLAWIGLLVTQAVLIARRRTHTHRSLGSILIGLVPLMVISGLAVSVWSSRRDLPTDGDAAITFFGGQLVDMTMFLGFSTAAYVARKDPQAHKRFILLATLAILGAAVGRLDLIGGYANLVTASLLLSIGVFDVMTTREIHRVTLVGGVLLLIGVFSQDYLFSQGGWLEIGGALLRTRNDPAT